MEKERTQLPILWFIVFIGFIGTSMPYPIFPPLFLHAEQTSWLSAAATAEGRRLWLGVMLAAYPFGQFIGLPILGSLSDQYGRKKILLISLFGSLCGYVLSALALHWHLLWMLLLSRLLTGVMEGNLAIVRAMAVDLTEVSKYESLGRINSAISMGYLFGPLFGGLLAASEVSRFFSPMLPFAAAACLMGCAIYLTYSRLAESHTPTQMATPLWQQFNLLGRLRTLCKNKALKHLLWVSTLFTLAVDTFYEFGPVYLAGFWHMSSLGIAFYNLGLCVTLAAGHGWLSHHLAERVSSRTLFIGALSMTAMVFFFIVVWHTPSGTFFWFALSGLSIAVGVNSITVQISNCASRAIQGEVMGTQLGLRTLGDAAICLLGGWAIIASVILPLAVSILAILAALCAYGMLQNDAVQEHDVVQECVSRGEQQ